MRDNFELSAADRLAYTNWLDEMPREDGAQFYDLSRAFGEVLDANERRESVAGMPPLPAEKHFSILYAFFGASAYVRVQPVRPQITEAQKLQSHANRAFRRIEKRLDRDIRTWNNQGYSND